MATYLGNWNESIYSSISTNSASSASSASSTSSTSSASSNRNEALCTNHQWRKIAFASFAKITRRGCKISRCRSADCLLGSSEKRAWSPFCCTYRIRENSTDHFASIDWKRSCQCCFHSLGVAEIWPRKKDSEFRTLGFNIPKRNFGSSPECSLGPRWNQLGRYQANRQPIVLERKVGKSDLWWSPSLSNFWLPSKTLSSSGHQNPALPFGIPERYHASSPNPATGRKNL